MANRSYVSLPARLLNYVLTGDDTGLDPRDKATCDRWFSPAVLGVILDVEPGPPPARHEGAWVCLVCESDGLSNN